MHHNQEKVLKDEYTDLLKKLEDPNVFSSSGYPKLARRKAQLETILNLFDANKSLK